MFMWSFGLVCSGVQAAVNVNMAVSTKWRILLNLNGNYRAPFQGFGVDIRQG